MKNLFFILILFTINLTAQENKNFLNLYDRHWEIEDGYYRVLKDGKIGVVNELGDVIVPCENQQIWNLQDNGNIKVLKDGKIGIYNISGNVVLLPIYDMIWDFKDGKARVLKNGKVGYVNETGNEFISCEYDQIWDFKDGMAKVLKNGKIGYITSSGTEIISAEYQKIWDFKDGIAKVLKNGKVGIVNNNGLEIVPCEYQQIWDFKDGIAKALKNDQIIHIDTNGNIVNKEFLDEQDDVDLLSQKTEEYIDKEQEENQIVKNTKTINILGNEINIEKKNKETKVSYKLKSKSTEKNKSNKKRNKRRRFDGHFDGIDLGFNTYITKDGSLSMPDGYEYLSLNSGKSIEFSLNPIQQNIALGRKIGFVTGLGLTYNNYRFNSPTLPVKDESGFLSYTTPQGNVEKNKLATVYLTAPLLFELQIGKSNHRNFYISGGLITGYKIGSHTKVVAKIDGKSQKDKFKDDFTLNDFRYGAQVRIGYDFINLYGSYYFTPLFDTKKAIDLTPISIGVSLYPDW